MLHVHTYGGAAQLDVGYLLGLGIELQPVQLCSPQCENAAEAVPCTSQLYIYIFFIRLNC